MGFWSRSCVDISWDLRVIRWCFNRFLRWTSREFSVMKTSFRRACFLFRLTIAGSLGSMRIRLVGCVRVACLAWVVARRNSESIIAVLLMIPARFRRISIRLLRRSHFRRSHCSRVALSKSFVWEMNAFDWEKNLFNGYLCMILEIQQRNEITEKTLLTKLDFNRFSNDEWKGLLSERRMSVRFVWRRKQWRKISEYVGISLR